MRKENETETALIAELFHQINIRISYSLMLAEEKRMDLMMSDAIFLDESALFEKAMIEFCKKDCIYTDKYLEVFEITGRKSFPIYTIQVKKQSLYNTQKIMLTDKYLEGFAEFYIDSLKNAYNKIAVNFVDEKYIKKYDIFEQKYVFDSEEILDEKEKILCSMKKLAEAWKVKEPNVTEAEYDLFQKAGTVWLSYTRSYMDKRFIRDDTDVIIDPIYAYPYLNVTDKANTCAISDLYIVQYNWEYIKKALLPLYKEKSEVKKIKTEAGKRLWFLITYGRVLNHLYLHEYRHILDHMKWGIFRMSEEEIDKWAYEARIGLADDEWEIEMTETTFVLLEDYSREVMKNSLVQKGNI